MPSRYICTKAAVNTVIPGSSGSPHSLRRGEQAQVRDRAGQVVRACYGIRQFAADVFFSPHTEDLINTSNEDLNNLTEYRKGHIHMHADSN